MNPTSVQPTAPNNGAPLNPQQIKDALKQMGTRSSMSQPDVKSSWDAFDAAVKAKTQPTSASGTGQPKNNLNLQGGGDIAQNYTQRWLDESHASAEDMWKAVKEGADTIQGQMEGTSKDNPIMAGLKLARSGGEAALGAGRALFAPITAGIGQAANSASDSANTQSLAMSKPVSWVLDKVNTVTQQAKDAAQYHPELTRNISDLANFALLALGDKGLPGEGLQTKMNIGDAKGIISDIKSNMAPSASGGTESAMGNMRAAGDIVKDASGNVIEGAKNKIGSFIKGKTLEEVLSTPEDQVHKLTPSERKAYFDNAQNKIKETSTNIEKKLQEEGAAKTDALKKEAEDLNRKLQVASRDETLKLRPKIQEAMGRQSQEYRRLVDEEIATKEDVPVTRAEIRDHVNARYAENPEQAQAIINRLGVGEETSAEPKVGKGEIPTISADAPAEKGTTIGNIYKQTLSLGQDIKGAAKKGTRVFTPGEKLTDDAISTLVDFMSEKGVDLSAARKFWAEYAPVRNQLISEAKPFNLADTNTKTFANTLTRVARGTDVNNENFIKATEDLLGEKIGGKTREAVAKLDANEKAQVAQKLDAETKKMDIKLNEERQSKAMSDKEFKVNRDAKVRDLTKKLLKWAVGGAAFEEVIRRF